MSANVVGNNDKEQSLPSSNLQSLTSGSTILIFLFSNIFIDNAEEVACDANSGGNDEEVANTGGNSGKEQPPPSPPKANKKRKLTEAERLAKDAGTAKDLAYQGIAQVILIYTCSLFNLPIGCTC